MRLDVLTARFYRGTWLAALLMLSLEFAPNRTGTRRVCKPSRFVN